MSSEGNHTMEIFVVSASRMIIDDHTTNTNFTIDDLMIKRRATGSNLIAPVSTLSLRLRRQSIKGNTKSSTNKERPNSPKTEYGRGCTTKDDTTPSGSGSGGNSSGDRTSFSSGREDNETGGSKQNSFEQVFHSIQYLSVSGSNGRETYPSCPTKMPLYPSTIPNATPEREFVLLATILPLGGTLLLAV